MVNTVVYYPTGAEKFRYNMQRRWLDYSDRVSHYNSEDSMLKRTDGVLIYHVLNTTVFINKPEDDGGRVNITGLTAGNVEESKSLLEEISKVRLLERV